MRSVRRRCWCNTSLAVIMSGALLLSGCATAPPPRPGKPLTQEEMRLRQQADTFNETVIEGAVLGGVLLGALAYLATKDRNKAFAAAAAGAAIGAGAGNYMAGKQQQYASEEMRLNAMIADVRSDNAKLARLNASARQVIAADIAKLKRIDAQVESGEISMAEARRELINVDENRSYLRSTLTNLQTRREEWARVAASVRRQGNRRGADAMDREVRQLEQQIATLQTELDELTQQRRISRVG